MSCVCMCVCCWVCVCMGNSIRSGVNNDNLSTTFHKNAPPTEVDFLLVEQAVLYLEKFSARSATRVATDKFTRLV
jgi:hypothetical protein